MTLELTEREAEILRQAALIIIEKLDGIAMFAQPMIKADPFADARQWLLQNGPVHGTTGKPEAIATIKAIRNTFNIGLKEAKDVYDSLFISIGGEVTWR
jgi:hypothetical protein